MNPRVAPLGDSALTLTWEGTVSIAHPLVRAAAKRMREGNPRYLVDLVPAYTTLSIYYDAAFDYSDVSTQVLAMIRDLVPERGPAGREVVIPVTYEGPDLDDVARRTGLAPSEVISRHTARTYDVYLVGFAPGWAYLGELDPALVLPRRPAPRQRVPLGSVAIANAQTGVYPFSLPGGWHLIGHTDTVMFDPSRTSPALLQVGDRVRFEARR